MRAIFCDLFSMVVSKTYSVYDYRFISGIRGCLRLMEARGWESIVLIQDIKTETFLSVIDALVLFFKISSINTINAR